MTSSTSDDIEVLSTMPPPASRLVGLDKEVLPEYVPKLIGDEEAPRIIHPEEGKIFSAVTDILVGEDSYGNRENNNTDFDDMSDVELEREYQKLSPGDKIQYNQLYSFHLQLQCNERCSGILNQMIRHQMCSKLFPAMPETVASEELSTYEVDPNHDQVEKVIQKDGAIVKKILPILIKAEPDQEHNDPIPASSAT